MDQQQRHPMIDVDQQIQHMKDSGVRFDLMSEDEAARYLQSKNITSAY